MPFLYQQNIGPILQSRADLASFCLEVTKKLNIKYESPPMPVNLSASGPVDLSGLLVGDNTDVPQRESFDTNEDRGKASKIFSAEDLQAVADLFQIRKSA